MSKSSSLSGKTIVITGASSGFGRGAALKFAASHVNLVLAARRTELLEEIARLCEARSSRVLVVPTDVSNAAEVEQLAQQAIQTFGRIDVWVNNAGVGALGKFEDIPLEEHVQVIETGLLGVIYGSYHAMRQFKKQNSGTLINVASALGKISAPYYSSYAAAKHGVVGLSTALRQELREDKLDNIHVCTVMPMAHDTPWFDHAANHTGHEAKPIPPLYDPQNVVDKIVELAEDPQDEVVVGSAGNIFITAHKFMRRMIENMMAKQTHDVQMKAPPANDTAGSVFTPQESVGTRISGGRLNK